MKTETNDSVLNASDCAAAMERFWREQMQSAEVRDGVVLTLPLMYPDGWQVSIRVSATTPGCARLSDGGKTLGTLLETGMSLGAKATAAILQERIQTFELRSDGAVLSKDVRLPLQGVDVQLFAEALVSIAHLVFRHEPATTADNPGYGNVQRLLDAREIVPLKNAELQGRLVRTRVDFLVEEPRPVAVQVISRRDNLLDYMEKWAFRWDDLKKQEKHLAAAMVYNPENQEWDSSALRIGQEVCDVFCRYDEVQALERILPRRSR